MGKNGSLAFSDNACAEMPSFKVQTVETTGAGGTFCGCVLDYILEKSLKDLTQTELEEMLRFANAAAAVVTTRKGALAVMPEKNEMEELMNRI
ncbi:MAG: PfkB family carbohydrate kinase [Ruminococcus sp.]|nr:PfkB family carbohydrate kinase [Ruminococcus sp.]